MDFAIELLQEVARTDLEQCQAAVRAGDTDLALSALERVFAKLDSAIDMLRDQPSNLG